MTLGERASLRQHTSKQVDLMLHDDGSDPIIAEIEVFPSFQEIVRALRREQETRHSIVSKR